MSLKLLSQGQCWGESNHVPRKVSSFPPGRATPPWESSGGRGAPWNQGHLDL